MQEAETRHGQRVSESSEGMMSIQQRCKVCLMYWMICGSPRLFSAVSHQREHELIFLSLRAGCSAKTLMSSNKKLETRNYHLPCESKMAISPPGSRLEKRPCQWLLDQSMKAQQRVRIEYHGLLHSRPMCALGWVLAISSPFIQSHFYSGRFLSNHITHSFVSHDFIFGKNYNTMYISLNFDFLKILEI